MFSTLPLAVQSAAVCRLSLSVSLALVRSAVRRCIHARWQEIIACPPHGTSNKRAVLMRAFLRVSLALSCSPSLTQSLHYSASPWSVQTHCLCFLQSEVSSLQLLLLWFRSGGSWTVWAAALTSAGLSAFSVCLAELGMFRDDGGYFRTSCGGTPPLNDGN